MQGLDSPCTMMTTYLLSLMVALLSSSAAVIGSAGPEPKRIEAQYDAPWHLQMVSNRDPGTFRQPYRYDDSAGTGIYVYVLDGGVSPSHLEFREGQVIKLPVPVDDLCSLVEPSIHATQIASMIAGQTVGVAKNATIVSVSIGSEDDDDCNHWRFCMMGMEHTFRDIMRNGRQNNSVVNLSLGYDSMSAEDPWACIGLNFWMYMFQDRGIPVVTAAGNEARDAINTCPGNASSSINVGSVDPWWWRSPYSNWGEAVDMLAPGDHVFLANASDESGGLMEAGGTSFAAPMVSGMVAYLLGKDGYINPTDMRYRLQEIATKDKIFDVMGSENLLLYNGEGF